MKKVICLFIPLIIILSCNREKKVKVVEEKYPDGSPKVEKYFNGDSTNKEMVKEVRYYPNKKEQMEGEFKNERRDGNWVYYYDNGNKWSEGSFLNGFDNGKRTTYFENGKVRYEGFYDKGKKVGTWKFWDEIGNLKKTIDFDKADTTSANL